MWVLHRLPSDTPLRLDRWPLLLGRDPSCDVVLNAPEASRRQALISWTSRGLEVLQLGRNRTLVNDEEVDGVAFVDVGDVIEFPGAKFKVVERPVKRETDGAWVIQHPDEGFYGVRHLPMTLGGGEGDDLFVPGWPETALTLHGAQGLLAVETRVDVVFNKHERLEPGSIETVEAEDCYDIGGTRIYMRNPTLEGTRSSTVVLPANWLPRKAHFEFLPRGGRLQLEFHGGQPVTVQLSELRSLLVAALLGPQGGYEAGDFVPDEVLIPSIWSGKTVRGRTDVNILVHRTRKNLLAAGVNPSVLVRAPKGGSTAFKLAPNAQVKVS